MTNKELADQIESVIPRMIPKREPGELIGWQEKANVLALSLAADLIRELPDPTPEPDKDLRWLVERHEWAFKGTLDSVPHANDQGDIVSLFWWRLTDSYINHEAALIVVRGIVKAMCDELNKDIPHPHVWQWLSLRNGRWAPRSPEGCMVECGCDTELEAIDALLSQLLTAMGEK